MRYRFVVRPRPTGDGYDLDGPTLPYGLWYHDETHAGDYAHFAGRYVGGTVVYLDSTGQVVVTETIQCEQRLAGSG